MKKYFIIIALFTGTVATMAQNGKIPDTRELQIKNSETVQVEKTKALQPKGDLYEGLTKKISYDRMIPPCGLEVCYDKTVHIIFPAAVKYVDLGSDNLMAGMADETENVIRVKSTKPSFARETNMSVITEDGCFYAFNVRYAKEPKLLNIEMNDFIHDGEAVNRPNNSLEVYLQELRGESPKVVRLILRSIYKNNKREIKHVGSRRFGVSYTLRGIYINGNILYFHTEIDNYSDLPFDVDYLTFKIVDKKVLKRTAIQEQVIRPLRAQNYVQTIGGQKKETSVFAFEKFTMPDDKKLVVELCEKNGGRHQSFTIENADLMHAKVINELKVK